MVHGQIRHELRNRIHIARNDFVEILVLLIEALDTQPPSQSRRIGLFLLHNDHVHHLIFEPLERQGQKVRSLRAGPKDGFAHGRVL